MACRLPLNFRMNSRPPAHVANGDAPAAIAILYGKAYETELERMQTQIDRFRQMLENRAAVAIDHGPPTARADLANPVGNHGRPDRPDVLFVLGFILKRRVLYPVVRLSDVVQRLASQDYAVETPQFTQVDEIGDMARAIRIFARTAGPPATGAAARRRLGDPRTAGAHDPAAAGL